MLKIYFWSFRECFFYFAAFALGATYIALETGTLSLSIITLLLYFPFILGYGFHFAQVGENQISMNSLLLSKFGKKPKMLNLKEPFDLVFLGKTSLDPLLEGLVTFIFPFMRQFSILDKDNQRFYVLSCVHIPKLLPVLYPFIQSHLHQSFETKENAQSLQSALNGMKNSSANKWLNILKKSGIDIAR